MTATDAAPDPVAAAERRWQDLLDRIHDLEARVATTTSTVNAALDHHLARLDALRHHLTHPDWPPSTEVRDPTDAAPLQLVRATAPADSAEEAALCEPAGSKSDGADDEVAR
ncbi:hypothetical protein ACFXPX_41075 [Kitasatospora sp. NPDC059146]|uniref:hypothetical protein n=1 Tax=unclassified Kitasatospora TaxID=2633591 RepID=UPI0036826BBB